MKKSYDLEGLRAWITGCGVVFIFLGAVMLSAVPSWKAREQAYSIYTYYHQATQAATPAEFAAAVTELDLALGSAGMIGGTTQVPWSPRTPQDDMLSKRGRIQTLALIAGQLTSYGVASTEASVGLASVKDTLEKVDVSVYGFWVWSQGGVWYALYIPAFLGLIGGGVVMLSLCIPDHITRRSGAQPSSV